MEVLSVLILLCILSVLLPVLFPALVHGAMGLYEIFASIADWISNRKASANRAKEEAHAAAEENNAIPIWPSQEPFCSIRRRLQQSLGSSIQKFSLTCRVCGDLAQPTPDTTNRYRCPKCRRQFSAARHNISIYWHFKRLPREEQQIIQQYCGYDILVTGGRHDAGNRRLLRFIENGMC